MRKRNTWSTASRIAALGALIALVPALALAQKGKPQPPPPPPVIPTADRVVYDLSVTVKKVAETDTYWMYTNGTGKTQITPRNGYHEGLPAWSPSGSRIAYIRQAVGKGEYYRTLWTMNADGSGASCVIAPETKLGIPSWSPDGSHIAIYQHPGDVDRIVLVKPDGTGMVGIVECGGPGQPTEGYLGPCTNWSPDLDSSVEGYQGLMLFAFHPYGVGQWDVRALRVNVVGGALDFPDGSSVESSATFLANNTICVWSPDGARVAWSAAGVVYVADVPYAGAWPVLPLNPVSAWAGYPSGHGVWGWSWDSANLIGTAVDSGGNSLGIYRYLVPEDLIGTQTPVRLGSDNGARPGWSPPVF